MNHPTAEFFALVPSDVMNTLSFKKETNEMCSCATKCGDDHHFIPVHHELADLSKYPLFTKEGMQHHMSQHGKCKDECKIKCCSLAYHGTFMER